MNPPSNLPPLNTNVPLIGLPREELRFLPDGRIELVGDGRVLLAKIQRHNPQMFPIVTLGLHVLQMEQRLAFLEEVLVRVGILRAQSPEEAAAAISGGAAPQTQQPNPPVAEGGVAIAPAEGERAPDPIPEPTPQPAAAERRRRDRSG